MTTLPRHSITASCSRAFALYSDDLERWALRSSARVTWKLMLSLAKCAVPANRCPFAPGSCSSSRSLLAAMARWWRNPALKPHFPISTATDRAMRSRRAYLDCARRSSGFGLTLRSKPSGALDTCWATRRLGPQRTVTATGFCENHEDREPALVALGT